MNALCFSRSASKTKKLKSSLTLVGGISKANVSHPLSFALAKDNHRIKIDFALLNECFMKFANANFIKN